MALQQPPHRALVVADAPIRLRHFEDPRDGPEVGGEPIRQCSASENSREPGQLGSRNVRGAARARDGSKRTGSPLLERPVPLADGRGGRCEASSDLRLGDPRTEETHGFQTSFLEGSGITVLLIPPGHGRGDRAPRILTHLCNGQ